MAGSNSTSVPHPAPPPARGGRPWSVFWCIGFLAALTLAVAMAASSRIDAHPDEIWHIRAAEYYVSHWIPPAVGDPDTVASYSRYGMSYLNERDVVYFFAGKFARALQPFGIGTAAAMRLFNLSQFAALGLAFLFRSRTRRSIGLLLLSPQIWYSYSYFNGDAFPLTIGMALALALPRPDSRPKEDSTASLGLTMGRVVVLAVGMILLAVSKKNYLVLVAFLSAAIAYRLLGREAAFAFLGISGLIGLHDFPSLSASARSASLLAVAGILVVGVVRGTWLAWQRRQPRGALAVAAGLALVVGLSGTAPFVLERLRPTPIAAKSLGDMVGQTAVGAYKPGETGVASLPGIGLRAKGVPFWGILVAPWYWPVIFAASASGFYGYMNLRAPWVFYGVQWAVYAFLAVGAIRALRRKRERAATDFALIAALCTAGLAAASAYHSWVNDFQAQGRYLFPVVPMIAVLATALGKEARSYTMRWGCVTAFVLAVVSFAVFGLARIPR